MTSPISSTIDSRIDTRRIVEESPYQGYSYSYPHKTAYRTLSVPQPLADVWRGESTDSLFLYLHVPFCEHRCGFCNLFTQANPEDGLTTKYLNQLQTEADCVAQALEETEQDFKFARLAIGGGTPTFLDNQELSRLFGIVTDTMQADVTVAPTSIEVSPATIDREKLALLSGQNVERISIGIQSFDEDEARQIGRPQRSGEVDSTLKMIREFTFPKLNIDLIYGGAGQTVDSWLASIRTALTYEPEELYLYPLYVRPLTGLGRKDWDWDDHRLSMYRAGREMLLESGYEQVSMRMFKRGETTPETTTNEQARPEYCCQSDGMVGIGCGARSYTSTLHYSTEYAVGRSGVKSILGDYVNRSRHEFEAARYGIKLSLEDRQRRFAIQSLLQVAGLDRGDFAAEFGADVLEFLPELSGLVQLGLAEDSDDSLRLTSSGVERSDAIGPWLYSQSVNDLMSEYELQ